MTKVSEFERKILLKNAKIYDGSGKEAFKGDLLIGADRIEKVDFQITPNPEWETIDLDGYSVSSIAQLQERLRYYKEGEKVVVTVRVPDGNKYTEKNITAVLSNRAENVEE